MGILVKYINGYGEGYFLIVNLRWGMEIFMYEKDLKLWGELWKVLCVNGYDVGDKWKIGFIIEFYINLMLLGIGLVCFCWKVLLFGEGVELLVLWFFLVDCVWRFWK